MQDTTKILAMMVLLALFTTGCQTEHEKAAESSFDDPAVAAYLQYQQKAIVNFIKASDSGKVDIAELAELRQTERLDKQKNKELMKNMSDSDRARYTSHMRRSAKQLHEATQRFMKAHGAGL